MHYAVYLPLIVAAVLGPSTPWLARQLPPATGSRLIAVSTVVAAAAATFSLGVLAFLLVARIPPAAGLARWSVVVLQHNPVPPVASVLAAVCCLGVLCSYARTMWRQVQAGLTARAHCARIGGEPGRLVVLDADHPDAYAVSAARGRIVVTRPLLQALTTAERRALLAHERAHLQHHHQRHRLAVALASAICPLLRPARAAIVHATERWADEAAAVDVADRRLVAVTLARASLLVGESGAFSARYATRAATGSVARRVRALLAPVPRQRPWLVLCVVALLVVSTVASLDTRADTEHLLEAAFRAGAGGQ